MHIKKLITLFVIFLLMTLCLIGCKSSLKNDIADYCYTINQRLLGTNFLTAYVSDGIISLYDSDGILIEELHFEEYDKNKEIRCIRKEGPSVYFVLSGSVDDEWGIMFINGVDNGLLDGIHSIERVGGNAYMYSTY